MDNSSSRARMLAQQRDLQLKKRQSAAQSAGMVRSSIDAKPNSPVRKADEQFTPAVRQFSAPKTLRDVDDDNDFDTEFNHKPAIKVNNDKEHIHYNPNKFNVLFASLHM